MGRKRYGSDGSGGSGSHRSGLQRYAASQSRGNAAFRGAAYSGDVGGVMRYSVSAVDPKHQRYHCCVPDVTGIGVLGVECRFPRWLVFRTLKSRELEDEKVSDREGRTTQLSKGRAGVAEVSAPRLQAGRRRKSSEVINQYTWIN